MQVRLLCSALFIIRVLLWLALVTYAPALALEQVTGMPLWFTILCTGVLTTIYTTLGGMKAVIWTDVVQLVLYLAGSVVAFGLLLGKIPGGWAEVVQVAAASGGKLSVFDFTFSLTKTYTFWSGLMGGAFLTMASHGTDQTIVQRLLAAKSEREGRLALLASGVIIFVQFALFLVIGVMLYVWQGAPAIVTGQSYDGVLPEFVVTQMPPGVAGLVLAAILAVAMSNASGSLNSLAASSVVDFSVLSGHETDPARFLRLSRRMTLVWGAVLLVLGTLSWGPLLEAGLTIASITFGSLLGLFLLGRLNRRATPGGALAGMAAGLAVLLCMKFGTPLAWTWYVLVGSAVTFAVGSVASFLKPQMREVARGD